MLNYVVLIFSSLFYFFLDEEGQDIVNRNYNKIPKILNYGSIATTSSNDNNLITLRTNELIENNETDPLKRDDIDTDIEIKNEPIDIEEFIGIFNTQNDKSKDNPHDQRDKNDSDVYKYKLINDYVYEKCFEHKNSGYRLTDEVVRNFGFEAVDKLNIQNFQFTGSITWLRNFKDSYNITGEYSDLKINDLPKKDENISTTNSIEKICENPSATDSINIPNNTITISRENLEKKMENAICYEKKVLLVDLSYKNPTWSVKKLRQKSGSSNISSVERLEKWRSQLKIKKTKTEMFQLINHWVYKKIIDYENKNEITDEQIEQWSIEAKKKFMFKNLHLSSSSNNWLKQFKENFELTCHYFDLKINPDNGVIEESSVKKVHIPHELRVKVVKLSNDKPSWNIDVLKDHTDCVDLKNDKQLDDWKRKIKKEQSIRDKYDKINNFIYDKCCSHKIKRKYKKITRKMLIDWRDEAKNHLGLNELPDVEFSPEWISKLKKQFFIE